MGSVNDFSSGFTYLLPSPKSYKCNIIQVPKCLIHMHAASLHYRHYLRREIPLKTCTRQLWDQSIPLDRGNRSTKAFFSFIENKIQIINQKPWSFFTHQMFGNFYHNIHGNLISIFLKASTLQWLNSSERTILENTRGDAREQGSAVYKIDLRYYNTRRIQLGIQIGEPRLSINDGGN